MPSSPDDRSAQSIAFGWASRVMTIALEMVVPGLLGYWIDQKLGTRVVFLLLGFALGSVLAGLSLAKIVRQKGAPEADREDERRP